jgi:hypothetical protein
VAPGQQIKVLPEGILTPAEVVVAQAAVAQARLAQIPQALTEATEATALNP